MPGQDQYVALPDGTYVHVPGNATPEQLAQLKSKLSAQAPPTGNAGTTAHPLVTPEAGESFADTMHRGAEMGKRVTPGQIDSATTGAIHDIPTVLAAASAPGLIGSIGEAGAEGLPGLAKFGLKMGRGLIGAGVGAGIGERGGAGVGGLFGENGRKIGGTLGAVGGGLLGGGLAAGLERNPSTLQIKSMPFGMQRAIPEWMVPGGVEDEEAAKAAFMNRGYKSALPEAAAPAELDQYGLPKNPANPDIGPLYSKIPSTMPKIGASGSGSPLVGAAPEQGGGVTVVPEPNPLFPGENPNYAASTPRDELIGQAQRGKPGAGTQLQQLGRPVIYRPKGVWDDEQ